jgi:hypothetical protein
VKPKLMAAALAALLIGLTRLPALAQTSADLLEAPRANGQPVVVDVAMHIMNLYDIDEVAQRFKLVCYLFAQWHDPRLVFTPRDANDRLRVMRPGTIWQPRFEFVNATVPHASYDTALLVTPDGTVKYTERVSASLSSDFQLRHFPFDRQRLSIFVHPFVDQAHLVVFRDDDPATSITTEERLYGGLAQWDVLGISAHTSMVPMTRGRRIAEIRFNILVKRRYPFYLYKVFLPLVLMVALSWTVFWVDPADLASQVQISVTTILTVIAFAFAISVNLPKMPYLTYIDAFFLTCYIFVFLTAVEVTTVHVAGRSRRHGAVTRIRRVSRIVMPICFVIVNLLVVLQYFK